MLGRYANACSLLEQEKEGPPILGKLHAGFKPRFKSEENRKEFLPVPHMDALSRV